MLPPYMAPVVGVNPSPKVAPVSSSILAMPKQLVSTPGPETPPSHMSGVSRGPLSPPPPDPIMQALAATELERNPSTQDSGLGLGNANNVIINGGTFQVISNVQSANSGKGQNPRQIPPNTNVEFEDYLYFAAIQRREEDLAIMPSSEIEVGKSNWFNRLSEHKGPNVNINVHAINNPIPPTEDELDRETASRALRLASWASVFYLITTDIFAPFNAPVFIDETGWVPGIIVNVVMGFLAAYTGLILWRLFVRLDSARHPLKTYGDIAERIFGPAARYVCTVLQSIQLLVNVATTCFGNGQALYQLQSQNICFTLFVGIWSIVGMFIGQIRSLKNYGWLASGAVWINLLIIFISMGLVAHTSPNFIATFFDGEPFVPITTQLFAHVPLFNRVNGIMNIVIAYGGAMIFPEIMAEMRRPMDFWKGMALAQILICVSYLLYGVFIYAFQGQYTLAFPQVVSDPNWATIGLILSLITGIIAAGLYGNIGIKIVYNSVIDSGYGPNPMSVKGRIIWIVLVLVYWSLAYLVASFFVIPEILAIVFLINVVALMQFTYTFPTILCFGYDVITDAMAADEPYVPGQGARGRVDTWRQWSRWKRGLFGGRWYFKLFNLILFLGGLVMAGMGMWGAVEYIVFILAEPPSILAPPVILFSCFP